jgi:pimeloyl-ACP methyl ester carboxylesterase
MRLGARAFAALLLVALGAAASAQVNEQIVDLPTRPGITQRLLVLAPPQPRAAVVLFAGGHGGLQLQAGGTMGWGAGNFLVRSRHRFAASGLLVAVIDAPSDRQAPPFLGGFRQRAEHAADVRAVIAWLRTRVQRPVWLVGTSRGTQSAAWLATELTGADGPDGVVLTATILRDDRGRPVPAMPLERIRVPVLVVHHEQDGCRHCAYADVPALMDRLAHVPRRELISFRGGDNVGDPCEARAYHGFNGLEDEVVARIASWMLAAK